VLGREERGGEAKNVGRERMKNGGGSGMETRRLSGFGRHSAGVGRNVAAGDLLPQRSAFN